MSEDNDFRYCNEELFGRDGGTSTAKAVEDAMDIKEVQPDEFVNARIIRQSLIAIITSFKASHRSFDAAVIHKWPGHIRNFWLQDKSDIFVEDCNSISPTHRQSSQPYSTNGGLEGGKVVRGKVKSAMIVAYKQI